jgi:carboxy-terminal domain RNA polymerase II polypeptide A small phosphatase
MPETQLSANPISPEIQRDQVATEPGMAKDTDHLTPEEGASSKKGRGMLQVPSRSSSQKQQSSPTSTGLSGATVSEARNSTDGASKDSKGSVRGRQRNGSASSKRTGGETDPTATPGNSQPNSPVQRRKKKGNRLLSLFGCCGTPDVGNGLDGDDENAHRLDKLPQRVEEPRAQTPQGQASKQAQEKDNTVPAEGEQKPADASDQISPVDGGASGSGQTAPPAVTIDPPTGTQRDNDIAEDAKTTNDEEHKSHDQNETSRDADTAVSSEDTNTRTIPPPPPLQGRFAATPLTEAGPSVAESQKWLLPPITPELKGRKCLVLDLDETLVHSSFKVCMPLSMF